MMELVLCVYTLVTPMKDGTLWREYPMIEGRVVKEDYYSNYVDFTESLRKLKAKSYWNNKVVWVRKTECLRKN